MCEIFVKKGCLYAFELLSRGYKCAEAFTSVNYERASDDGSFGPGCLFRP